MLNQLNKPLIMGILNITPDSFSDGGKYSDLKAALSHVELMISEGADIIDIGGESTRPGSDSVSATEQIHRVIRVIKAIRCQLNYPVLISIDTTSSAVAKAALDAGATIINDVSAGKNDPALLTLAAQMNAEIIFNAQPRHAKNDARQTLLQECYAGSNKRLNHPNYCCIKCRD